MPGKKTTVYDDDLQQKGIASKAFDATTCPASPELIALVRHLARISAEADYNYLLKTGQIPYTGPHTKGL